MRATRRRFPARGLPRCVSRLSKLRAQGGDESPQSEESLDPAQLLPVLRKLAATHNLDLATMPPEQKGGFIASVLLQGTGQSPESITDEARNALIEEATRIAEQL